MRTNIEIDDDLMAAAMAAGGFKTKKEAVEEGLRLVRRRQVYNGLLALRGKLQWDDSDAAWAQARTDEAPAMAVQEPKAAYSVPKKAAAKARTTQAKKPVKAARSKAK
jgi:antitoxin ParD1/3/4